MAFEDNQLLLGSDSTPRIVAIELGDTGTVKVYRREKYGATTCEIEEFLPFAWADGDVADLGPTNAEKPACDLKYNWLVTADSWKKLIALRNGLKKAGRNFFCAERSGAALPHAYGRTFRKQVPFEELKRMQIEVLSFSDGHLDAAADDHTAKTITRLTSLIKERDSDVSEPPKPSGHVIPQNAKRRPAFAGHPSLVSCLTSVSGVGWDDSRN